jgi:hypothetical protein
VSAIREAVEAELSAFILAHRALAIAEKMRRDAPDDRVAMDRVHNAIREKREAGALLRAALSARGFSYADLQAEMKSLR